MVFAYRTPASAFDTCCKRDSLESSFAHWKRFGHPAALAKLVGTYFVKFHSVGRLMDPAAAETVV